MNSVVKIGEDANDEGHFSSGAMKTYGRESMLVPFNPEGGGPTGEGAANSVVNVKNMDIYFKIPEIFEDEIDRKSYRQYIENTVMPYLAQMIPSTSILGLYFEEES